jgi:hypothetical protein
MDYPSLVHRVRELVWEYVPAGSNVAVVSKGDPALILFDRRNGWHYPQTASGQYLGHHPQTGAAAVAYLETLRERGAQYLVIPAIYSWFMDYYTDLRAHLNRAGELIHRDDVCAIYCLTKREAGTVPTSNASDRQLRELVGAVLPQGSTIIAFGRSHAVLADSGFRLLETPSAGGPGDAGLAGLTVAIRGAGAEYVVFPASQSDPAIDEIRRRCRGLWPTVLDHRHVCAVFEVRAAALNG